VSVDDEAAGLGEIEFSGLGVDWVEGVKGHAFIGSDEVWPGIKLVSGKSSLR